MITEISAPTIRLIYIAQNIYPNAKYGIAQAYYISRSTTLHWYGIGFHLIISSKKSKISPTYKFLIWHHLLEGPDSSRSLSKEKVEGCMCCSADWLCKRGEVSGDERSGGEKGGDGEGEVENGYL